MTIEEGFDRLVGLIDEKSLVGVGVPLSTWMQLLVNDWQPQPFLWGSCSAIGAEGPFVVAHAFGEF